MSHGGEVHAARAAAYLLTVADGEPGTGFMRGRWLDELRRFTTLADGWSGGAGSAEA